MNDFQKTESSYYKYYLPIEIWESILKKLIYHPRALVSASKVCKSWRHLVTEICKQFCLKKLHKNEIQELSDVLVHPFLLGNGFEEEENEGRNWVKVFWYHHETYIDTDPSSCSLPSPPYPGTANSLESIDPYLIISSYDESCGQTKLCILNGNDFPLLQNFEYKDIFVTFINSQIHPLDLLVDGKLCQVNMLQLATTSVVMLVSSMDLRAIVLKRLNDDDSTKSKADIVFTSPRLLGDSKISCDKEWLLTFGRSESMEFLSLYKASLSSSEKDLQLQLMFTFKPLTIPYMFHIFQSTVYTMEPSGHIRGYKIEFSSEECDTIENVNLYCQSELKKDLRYPNPTRFVRNFVFSSTIISAELLRYWHMDRGRDFWIVGDLHEIYKDRILQINDPSSDIYNIRLNQMYLGLKDGFIVTAVHEQRGIFFFGTKEGHIAGYKMYGNGEFEKPSRIKPDLLDSRPWMLLHCVSSQPITQIRPLFTPLGVIVAAIDMIGNCLLVSFSSKTLS